MNNHQQHTIISTTDSNSMQGYPSGGIGSTMSSVECLLEGEAQAKVMAIEADDFAEVATLSTHNLSSYEKDFSDEEDDNDTDTDNDEPELSWRLDPKESLSDWTVQVVVKGTNTQLTYHVHKSVLAIGPRRSNYFTTAFFKQTARAKQSQRTASNRQEKFSNLPEAWSCTPVASNQGRSIDFVDTGSSFSRIELHRLAVEAFPAMLDYIYSSTGKLEISTSNATALYALSQHLEIKSLRRLVKEFWTADLNMENICIYYQHGRVFNDRKLLTAAEEYCSGHIYEVEEKTVVDILTTVDPLFFLRVVSHQNIGTGEATSLRLSLLIAVYCNIHKSELDKNMFLRLTASSHLPKLEIKAARALLEIEDDICGESNRNYISSLKNRCISVLSENWDAACIRGTEPKQLPDSIEDLRELVDLPRLYSEPLELFSSMAFLNARKRMDQIEAEKTALQQQNEALQREVKHVRRQMDQMALLIKKANPLPSRLPQKKESFQESPLKETSEKNPALPTSAVNKTSQANPAPQPNVRASKSNLT